MNGTVNLINKKSTLICLKYNIRTAYQLSRNRLSYRGGNNECLDNRYAE